MNACLPMNNKTLVQMLDVAIILKDGLYEVLGLTESFCAVSLGKFDNVLEAYGKKVSYGFNECTYEVPISPFENKVVEFTLD